jgi:REP element-mobilizing transposase RayT
VSKHIQKRHNVSKLLYHFVCPAKYRRVVITEEIDTTLRKVCFEISHRYEITFVEIGADKDHVHFLVQSVPKFSPTKIIMNIKSITAKEMFLRHPELKKQLWGGNFWTSGFYANTVGASGNEEAIKAYVRNQGREGEYQEIHRDQIFFS